MKQHPSLQETMRIVWAIVLKDLVDAIKNKTILSGLGSVVFVVLMYRFMPALTRGDELPNLLLHDGGTSELAIELEDSPSFRLFTYDSLEEMQRALVRADRQEIGLALPADLERQLQGDQTLVLGAYGAYWLAEDDLFALAALTEQELAHYAGKPVRLTVHEQRVYPEDPGVPGSGFMVSISIVLVVTMAGVLTISHLMLEEKQTHTLDALRVSPASSGQLLLGKALVGLIYCLAGVCAVYVLNANYVVRWEFALLAGVLGAAFGTSLGTLIGSVCESQQQVTLYGFFLMGGLLLPPFVISMAHLIPAGAIDLLRWLPTSAIAWLVRASFAPTVPLGAALLRTSVALAWTAALFALAVWRVRRLDR